MGVPKFFRWISERYPCLSEIVKEYQIPEFDNLYLDMNGVIHICSHPEDDNPHFRITEEAIFKHICHYLEFLFRMIKPRKVFFMAVDGVAPRAKMNQQRGRRFRSAKDAVELIKKAVQKGEKMPDTKRFDSNCITPGTGFMDRLQKHLKYFVQKKISTDPLWQNVDVILSGHETPGEGEHKVQDYIRYLRSQPDQDPNTRHCLYGLDADLIMLGLACHEPHFSLLRENVRFTKGMKHNKRAYVPEETHFYLLHISLLREYIDYEFQELKDKLPYGYDVERIIDDWVLMGFLVGNDFVPHLPNFHIHGDALPLLWATYKTVMPKLDGYLNELGKVNLPRFLKYIDELSKYDKEWFTEKHADDSWMMGKRGHKLGRQLETLGQRKPTRKKTNGVNDATANGGTAKGGAKERELTRELTGLFGGDEGSTSKPEKTKKRDKTAESLGLVPFEFDEDLVDDPGDLTLEDVEDDSSDDDDDDDVESSDDEDADSEYRMHKRDYYETKLGIHNNPENLKEQARQYILAIQWILYYYYRGVQSWSWFYPQHYAPFVSDLRYFPDPETTTLEFERAHPFLPFEQLMAVLPAESRDIMPEPFQCLMVNSESPVIDFYPQDFPTDLNGKKQDWEAVVLIPFIEERRLLAAMNPLKTQLTEEETRRNRHGPHTLYHYTSTALSPCPYPLEGGNYPPIKDNHAQVTTLPMDKFLVTTEQLVMGLREGARTDLYHLGFPSLVHVPHSARLENVGVKVFEMTSRNASMVLRVKEPAKEPVIESLAKDLLGKPLYVNWPHFHEVLVVKIMDKETRYRLNDDDNVNLTGSNGQSSAGKVRGQPIVEKINQSELKELGGVIHRLADDLKLRRAIEVGRTDVVLWGRACTGVRYVDQGAGRVLAENQWSACVEPFLFQQSVRDLQVSGSRVPQCSSVVDLFPEGVMVFSLGAHYGYQGQVISASQADAKIKVNLFIQSEPNFKRLIRNQRDYEEKYYPSHFLARTMSISGFIVSRITGCLYLIKGSRPPAPEAGQAAPPVSWRNLSKVNVGLNLKFNRHQEEVPGWTKKTEDGNGWLYSERVVGALEEYRKKFPELFHFLEVGLSQEHYYDTEVFTENTIERTRELTSFLKELPCANAPRAPQGHAVLSEAMITEIEKEVARHQSKMKKCTEEVTFKSHDLYREHLSQGSLIADPNATYEMLDRVVNVRAGYAAPLGLRGTIIGILKAPNPKDTMYEVVMDEEFEGGLQLRSSTNRCYRLPEHAMINLTYGERKQTSNQQTKTAVQQTNQKAVQQTNQKSVQQTNQKAVQQTNQKAVRGAGKEASRDSIIWNGESLEFVSTKNKTHQPIEFVHGGTMESTFEVVVDVGDDGPPSGRTGATGRGREQGNNNSQANREVLAQPQGKKTKASPKKRPRDGGDASEAAAQPQDPQPSRTPPPVDDGDFMRAAQALSQISLAPASRPTDLDLKATNQTTPPQPVQPPQPILPMKQPLPPAQYQSQFMNLLAAFNQPVPGQSPGNQQFWSRPCLPPQPHMVPGPTPPPSICMLRDLCSRFGIQVANVYVNNFTPQLMFAEIVLANPPVSIQGTPQPNEEAARISAVHQVIRQLMLPVPLLPPVNSGPVPVGPGSQIRFFQPPIMQSRQQHRNKQYHADQPPERRQHRPYLPPELAENPFGGLFYDPQEEAYGRPLQSRYSLREPRPYEVEGAQAASAAPQNKEPFIAFSTGAALSFVPVQVARQKNNAEDRGPQEVHHVQEVGHSPQQPNPTLGTHLPKGDHHQGGVTSKPRVFTASKKGGDKKSRIAANFGPS